MSVHSDTGNDAGRRTGVLCRFPTLARFRRDARGVTAIEFGLVAVPFFALMFAILETALVFFAGQALETAIGNSARLIRTGQAQQEAMSAADFRTSICDQVFQLFDCEAGLQLDVRIFPTFDSITLTPPFDDDGALDVDDFTYEIGDAGDIVVVRAFYEWPVIVTMLGNDLSNYGTNKHLLAAAAAFKNEPFPW
jgi:Flp pilus assembly protein TadG